MNQQDHQCVWKLLEVGENNCYSVTSMGSACLEDRQIITQAKFNWTWYLLMLLAWSRKGVSLCLLPSGRELVFKASVDPCSKDLTQFPQMFHRHYPAPPICPNALCFFTRRINILQRTGNCKQHGGSYHRKYVWKKTFSEWN